jgi:CubicO group peptidase (beta-lactamase class C family)
MKTDSIFRIASMTKPITSVAVMMLAEVGKIDIGAPVATYLPEFKDVKVGIEKPEAPKRPVTVQDLLRHTSGLTYGFFGNSAGDQLYMKANLLDRDQTLAGMVTKISKLPLAYQPGTVWEYSMSTDVLGRIVEVVSGMDFDRFIRERITQPLKMPDTAFYVTPQQAGRLVEPQLESATGQRPVTIPPIQAFTTKPRWMSGGGGLVSTAADYARFCQMLLNGGDLDGVRLLSPKTVALMTSDHLPPGIPRSAGIVSALGELAPTPEMGQGFGLGFAVRTQAGRNPLPGSVGDFFWAGITGTYFWVDPKEKLFAVLMIQVPVAQTNHYFRIAREMVYAALIR